MPGLGEGIASIEDPGGSRLAEIASRNAFVLGDTSTWLHRRVERINYTDRRVVRRQFSVDFTIPASTGSNGQSFEPYERLEDGREVFYVPIALLAKWPPLLNLSLWDEDDRPLPLLTSPRNRLVDREALLAFPPRGPMFHELSDRLGQIATHSRPTAMSLLKGIGDDIARELSDMTATDIAAWQRTLTLAAALVGNSLLWVRLSSRHGERHIIKCSYEEPEAKELVASHRLQVSLGWRRSRHGFEVPNLGARGSYHLEITPPPGLEVVNASLELSKLPPRRWEAGARVTGADRLRAYSRLPTRLWRALKTKRRALLGTSSTDGLEPEVPSTTEPRPGEKYERTLPERAYFYVSGIRDDYGVATVAMASEQGGMVAGALAAAIGIASLITAVAIWSTAAISHATETVTTLVIAPGLLGLFASQVGEHPIARAHVAGVRILVLLAGALAVIAAVALIIAGSGSTWWLRGTAIAAWFIVALLTLSWLLPAANELRE